MGNSHELAKKTARYCAGFGRRRNIGEPRVFFSMGREKCYIFILHNIWYGLPV